MHETQQAQDRAILIQPSFKRAGAEMAELRAGELDHLARSAGLLPVKLITAPVAKISSATYFGKGRVEEFAAEVIALEADVVVLNESLSPIQQRNLERALKAKVVDRTGIILEIFAARARTSEGRLQVELASLLYQQSRLVRSWTHLERQRGGVGLRGGPGESQIELDRRMIRERIGRLKKELTQVERTRALHRQTRQDVPYFSTALVGYTNAGKSTLFNRLSGATVFAEDKLFATLDPTMRGIVLPGGVKAILSDTVGFVRDLPHQLVAAFRATLEEVHAAELLIHVVDLSDPAWEQQSAAVTKVLEELEAQHKPMVTFYNKMDRLPPDSGLAERLRQRENTVIGSAIDGQGLPELLHAMAEQASSRWQVLTLDIPMHEGGVLARLYRECRILHRDDSGDTIRLTLAVSQSAVGRLRALMHPFLHKDESV